MKRKQYRDSDAGKAVAKAYNSSEAGKANIYRKNHSNARKEFLKEYGTRDGVAEKKRAAVSKWASSSKGKAKISAWNQSDIGKISKRKSSAKYKASAKGYANAKRRKMWLKSSMGISWKKTRRERVNEIARLYRASHPEFAMKQNKKKSENRDHENKIHRQWIKKNHALHMAKKREWLQKQMKDSSFRLQLAIQKRLSKMVKGYRSNSGTTFQFTEFKDAEDAINHFESQFKPGMRRYNYGWFWNHDHLIARKHYDWTNEEDIRRCQSKKNLVPEYVNDNCRKGTKLPPKHVLDSMRDIFPLAWNCEIPNNLKFL